MHLFPCTDVGSCACCLIMLSALPGCLQVHSHILLGATRNRLILNAWSPEKIRQVERRRWGPKGGHTRFLTVVLAGRKEGEISFPRLCFQGREDECHQEKRCLPKRWDYKESVIVSLREKVFVKDKRAVSGLQSLFWKQLSLQRVRGSSLSHAGLGSTSLSPVIRTSGGTGGQGRHWK